MENILGKHDRPIEAFVVSVNPESGWEEWFRSASLQGFSADRILRAARSGEEAYGYYWKVVPAEYRIVTGAGQELVCRWDKSAKAFRDVVGGAMILRKWCKEIVEYACV